MKDAKKRRCEMVKKIVAAAAALLLVSSALMAEVKMGMAASSSGGGSFYLTIGDYNRVPEKEVIVVKQRGIPDEELPVVYFLAAKAKVKPEEVIKFRLRKWGWMKIANKLRVHPEVFYIELNERPSGMYYGKAFGQYYKYERRKWNKIRLSDEDVVNIVNLKVISEHYRRNPVEIIKMRETGKTFVAIDREFREEKLKMDKLRKKGPEKYYKKRR